MNSGTLLNRKWIKIFSFLSKICDRFNLIKQTKNNEYFLLFENVFNWDHLRLRLIVHCCLPSKYVYLNCILLD